MQASAAPYLSGGLLRDLAAASPAGVQLDLDLSRLSRWRVGGKADCVVTPGSLQEARAVFRTLEDRCVPYITVGSMSNLLFSDAGLRAVCVQIGSRMAGFRADPLSATVWCQAGIWVPGFARRVAREGMAGVEHVCGIPGTLGGLICMNGGSQRRGIGDNVLRVLVKTPGGEMRWYARDECQFAYRTSRFQAPGYVVLEAEFGFDRRDSYPAIRRRMLDILRDRRRKFPQKLANCGSVFVSDPALYARFGPPGAIIESLGLKGLRIGGAEVSRAHANFINNIGGATARDVLAIISLIRDAVHARTGLWLQAEVRYVTEQGHIVPASDIGPPTPQ